MIITSKELLNNFKYLCFYYNTVENIKQWKNLILVYNFFNNISKCEINLN